MWPFDLVDWVMLSIPIAYLFILVGSLYTFSSIYRKRKAYRAASLEPWFSPHLQRNVYLSLLHQEDPKVPDSILKAALLRRAVEDISRIIQVRSQKQALQVLLQRGSVGDDLWQRFQRAEKEIEDELRDVVSEANAFAPNWGQTIFQTASELAQNAMLRDRVNEILSTAESEHEWWDKRKSKIQADFMKELDEEKVKSATEGSVAGSVAGSVKGAKTVSDDDAVLVEGGGPAEKAGKGKKKKGKN
ncbi:translocation protein-like protein sec66 [Bimuria novae-zelandiae CBS 107.79]|uniref:Translocation protein-like protein sec66 n=1 Tax=Bimuria novae-zelandiae CBS 107.79 TaxID=1447943 RepID=A0A6A5VDN5_9PLEO|nr:translocation protein-like protein sec66 [Bimuria novae-zelandiae CBS 107.79]